MISQLTRRGLVQTLAVLAAAPAIIGRAHAAPSMIVHRDPGCGCCEAWVAHIRAAGFSAQIVNEPDMSAVKARLRVPDALVSCHTAEIDGYAIEGHVPAAAILRLLQERPEAFGLAVPGMIPGSPGMEGGGAAEVYEVILFGAAGQKRYGRFIGVTPA